MTIEKLENEIMEIIDALIEKQIIAKENKYILASILLKLYITGFKEATSILTNKE